MENICLKHLSDLKIELERLHSEFGMLNAELDFDNINNLNNSLKAQCGRNRPQIMLLAGKIEAFKRSLNTEIQRRLRELVEQIDNIDRN